MPRAKKNEENVARAEDVLICAKCGNMIIGEFDHVRTRRGTHLYFHKGMRCLEGKNDSKNM